MLSLNIHMHSGYPSEDEEGPYCFSLGIFSLLCVSLNMECYKIFKKNIYHTLHKQTYWNYIKLGMINTKVSPKYKV